jgi:large subunit ribosomal protein L32
MAVPKRRTSKSKKRMRRTHYKATAPTLSPCPKCGEARQPHRVCPNCGYYKGVKRLVIEDA